MKNIIENMSKVFESRIRLGLMSILVVNDAVDFNTLKETMSLTDGNLATHLSVLERNNLVDVKKRFVGKKPMTTYSATKKGRDAFTRHLDALEEIIKRNP